MRKYIEHKEYIIEEAKNAAKSTLNALPTTNNTHEEKVTFETNLICYGNSILSRLMISEQAK